KIVSSKGHWSGDRRDSHFRVYITFSYEWKGAQYESDDYQLFGWAEGRDVLKRHPAGSETLCFVNPETPHQAAIDRSFPVESVGIIVSSIFAVIGLVTIILAKLGKFDEDGEEPTHSTTQ
ncbi:MAG: DUF3592 domain-containing protein, partial [Planctomycetaceae bacterium]|nr:DUF3592 domain-containing protein [Planctomycetaceae bacterium]